MNLDIKLKFNFNKRNRYKNICSIEGCNNMYNTYRQRNNSTGVRKHIQKGKYISYQAYISINNKQINLGYFDTKEKAIAARKFAERKYNINNFSY